MRKAFVPIMHLKLEVLHEKWMALHNLEKEKTNEQQQQNRKQKQKHKQKRSANLYTLECIQN